MAWIFANTNSYLCFKVITSMRYILDISSRDYKLIRASLVNFQKSLEASSEEDFESLIEELDNCYLSITRQQKMQLKNKLRRKWGVKT